MHRKISRIYSRAATYFQHIAAGEFNAMLP
jgi:hypothetical protein